jgi:hypothetical protein
MTKTPLACDDECPGAWHVYVSAYFFLPQCSLLKTSFIEQMD